MNGIPVRASDGLVVVDAQNDFVSGSLAIPARYGCVQATAEDAQRLGFEALIVDDASAGRPTDDAPAQDAVLAAKGIGWVSSEQLT